jgi:hypothetical protein
MGREEPGGLSRLKAYSRRPQFVDPENQGCPQCAVLHPGELKPPQRLWRHGRLRRILASLGLSFLGGGSGKWTPVAAANKTGPAVQASWSEVLLGDFNHTARIVTPKLSCRAWETGRGFLDLQAGSR